MKSIIFIMFTSIVLLSTALSQVQNVPAENPVYDFLKQMQVKGILDNYDNTILPLSRSEVTSLLKKVKTHTQKLTSLEFQKVLNYLDKFDVDLSNQDPSSDFAFKNNIKHLYSFSDSTINFLINPVLGTEYINYLNKNNNAVLVVLGGNVSLSYNDWFGFYLTGSNGFLKGDREAAIFNRNVLHSFTFNQTNLNYFDNTEGYAKFRSTHLNFQLGRERILWGSGFNNRLLLSNNPPIFDFIKFDFNYKNFSYNFLHGWLVRAPYGVPIDSIHQAKLKDSKYIAISRLGYKPLSNLAFGISQAIIYSDRPFEAAYLNPFLFWESAQRSLNDLDNSFLIVDARYKPIDGLEVNSSFLIDDVNFEVFGDWDHVQNSYAFQTGLMLTDPIIFNNLTFKGEYLFIRPYVFSHRGFKESLSYSNNGNLLGAPFQPNSINISLGLHYDFSFNLGLDIQYSNTRHGANYYDADGKMIKNFGGNMLESFGFYQDDHVAILSGKKETLNEFRTGLTYEILFGLSVQVYHILRIMKTEDSELKDQILFGNIQVKFE